MNRPVVLVTGASGLIGSHLVDHLLAQDCLVVGLAKDFPLSDAGLAQFSAANYVRIVGDVCDGALLEKIFAQYRPTHAVHLAAQAIVETASRAMEATFETNIKGTWCLLEAARHYGRLDCIAIASSDKAYGEHNALPCREDTELKAVYPYDVSKKITEEIAMSYFHAHGMPVVITRCGNVFGPYDLNLSRIVPGTILSCLRHEKVILRSNGLHQRCYVYARDVADAYFAILMAAAGKTAGQAFNIGNDRPVAVIDMARAICTRTGKGPLDIVVEDRVRHEISSQSLDCSKIKQLLGWEERYVMGDALDETIAWYTSVFERHPYLLTPGGSS